MECQQQDTDDSSTSELTDEHFKPIVQSKCSDFSIARILGTNNDTKLQEKQDKERYEWLHCTRYKPPRLPRTKRREGTQRRKLGRNPRIPFSSGQVGVLEQRFRRGHYLSSVDVVELATFLSLSETRVKIWFQNRRARERRDREAKQQQILDSSSSASDLSISPGPSSQDIFSTSSHNSAFTPVFSNHSSFNLIKSKYKLD